MPSTSLLLWAPSVTFRLTGERWIIHTSSPHHKRHALNCLSLLFLDKFFFKKKTDLLQALEQMLVKFNRMQLLLSEQREWANLAHVKAQQWLWVTLKYQGKICLNEYPGRNHVGKKFKIKDAVLCQMAQVSNPSYFGDSRGRTANWRPATATRQVQYQPGQLSKKKKNILISEDPGSMKIICMNRPCPVVLLIIIRILFLFNHIFL